MHEGINPRVIDWFESFVVLGSIFFFLIFHFQL